jgi:nucleotide-binding universal stress UspA family protein
MYKKILVGIDDSEDAKHAAEKAIPTNIFLYI